MSLRPNIELVAGLLLGIAISTSFKSLWTWIMPIRPDYDAEGHPKANTYRRGEIVDGVPGNTPLVRIKSLSEALGVEILMFRGKQRYLVKPLYFPFASHTSKFLNPGGSVKDRVAMKMIDDAETTNLIKPGTNSRIFEGTVGSTGISIATLAAARGYRTRITVAIIMPDDIAAEKVLALRALGAEVEQVRPASIVDKKQASPFVNLAKIRAQHFGRNNKTTVGSVVSTDQGTETSALQEHVEPRGFFADQFENMSNFSAHYEGTGPEIWRQTDQSLDAFVSGAGTGGTIAGVACYLKERHPQVRIILSDPEGSGLYNKVKHGVMYDPKESEGRRRRHQVDTVVEGIGINRLTRNFQHALPLIDDAIRVTDEEAVSMARYLVKHDGLFLGSSSGKSIV
ncbi:hypothetical protein FRC17_005864 [Serendipita sp. 399]|nr:hypothetical protein FRC17_005864 [Serendipita sp. 399]